MAKKNNIYGGLDELREEINSIDDQMVSLLQKRMGVVSKVAKLKTDNKDTFFIRSAREADMIKNLIEKAKGSVPLITVVNLWRKIITAANMSEQKLSVAIHNQKNIPDLAYLVKNFYNETVPVRNFDSATKVITELESKKSLIGGFILPDVNSKDEEDWWIRMANNKSGLKVFATIPAVQFVDSKGNNVQQDQIRMVAVAIKEAEKSNDDNTLLCLEVNREISRDKIVSILKDKGFKAEILKTSKLQHVDNISFHLVTLDGFYLKEDLKNFIESDIKPHLNVLGHYAKPIVIDIDN